MKYNELTATPNKDRKRVGRGIGSGYGKTAGRGTKGQGARTGKGKSPLVITGGTGAIRQLPKARGFKSKRVPAQVVYADQLNDISAKVIDNFVLFEEGLIATPFHSVKVIARNEMTCKAKVCVAGMSASVQEALTKNGGSFESTPVPLPVSTKEAEMGEVADEATEE